MAAAANPQTAHALKEAAEALAAPHYANQPPAGRVNIYVCDACREHIVTRDVDVGVTPFMVSCRCTRACQGKMVSSMYRVFDQNMLEGFQWYRPEPHQALTHPELDHVSRGGLLLRVRP